MSPKGAVEVAPFRQILIDAMEKRREDYSDDPQVTEFIADKARISTRVLYRLLNEEQETLAFDKADGIVTGILGPMAWHEDETLSRIYQEADLRSLDWSDPVSPVVRRELASEASEAYQEEGTLKLTERRLGISRHSISRLLAVPA
jgi:hypothetical protein